MTEEQRILEELVEQYGEPARALLFAIHDLRDKGKQRIVVRDLIESEGFDRDLVIDALTSLWLADKLDATYRPDCATCGNAIGPRERTEREIRRKIHADEYPDVHTECGGDAHPISIRVELWFRRPELS